MTIRLSAPSKTFLSGEYAVLSGGPALVLATEPRFTFTATRRGGKSRMCGIPEGSPAAKWLELRSSLVVDWELEFLDPHEGRGGFGASSAQFLFVHAFTTFLQSSVRRAVEGYDLNSLWSDYQKLTGGTASGADLLAQTTGQVSSVTVNSVQLHSMACPWPFSDLSFAIVRTDQKVQTHRHLAELDRAPLQALVEPAKACLESFVTAPDVEKFLVNARRFAMGLRELGLQAPTTLAILNSMEEHGWCKLAKGCGAMGADTVLVCFARADEAEAFNFFAEQKLAVVAARVGPHPGLSGGLEMNWSWT